MIDPVLFDINARIAGYRPNATASRGVSAGTVRALPPMVTPVTAPANDTTYNTLATLSIPSLGPKDSIDVSVVWTVTSSTNVKNFVLELGSTQILLNTMTTANAWYAQNIRIQNMGASNSQTVYNIGNTGATGVAGIFTIDLSTSKNLVVKGQKVTGTETLTLQTVHIMLAEGV